MNKDIIASTPQKKLHRLRSWNRKRNYFIKKVKHTIRLYIAKIRWDRNEKTLLDVEKIKTVLLLRNEGAIGDVIVDSTLVKALHHSGYVVDFLLTKNNSLAIKYNPYIRNIYEANDVQSDFYLKEFSHNVPDEVISILAKNKYDLVIDPSIGETPLHRMKMFSQIKPRFVFGFNKWNKLNYYNKSFAFDVVNNHIKNIFTPIAKSLNLSSEHLSSYDIHLPVEALEDVRNMYANKNKEKLVVINIFAGNSERCISQGQLSEIINLIQEKYKNTYIILLDHRREIKLTLPDNVVINPFKTPYHMMALIHESDLVISPDTSIVHISAAWKKPLVAVYKNLINNNVLWGPGYGNASQVIIPNGHIYNDKMLPHKIMSEIEKRAFL